ncbi:hypothetical protein BVI434_2080001 [Burkholderia vietnamiensis]|nr:hypothetical protein BVI434_2080001 [Burkholderia vietnamiensis]
MARRTAGRTGAGRMNGRGMAAGNIVWIVAPRVRRAVKGLTKKSYEKACERWPERSPGRW